MEFVIDIVWGESAPPNMPPLVGPFPNREEAEGWAKTNIPNGTWEIHPLTYPYRR